MPGETTVPISPGTGEQIDVTNVGTGDVGSGNEVLRQVMVVGDSVLKGSQQGVDADGNASVRDNTMIEVLAELRRIRIGISILINEDLEDSR